VKPLMKRISLPILTICAVALAFGQTPAPKLSFEVASIKPSPPIDPVKIQNGQQKIGMSVDKARVDLAQSPIIGLIMAAYKPIQLFQVQGPAYIMTDRFDIVAKMPEGATKDDVPELLKSLLADRFAMKYHMETKEHSVFALSLAKTGSKLVEAKTAEELAEEDRAKPADKGENVINAGDAQVRVKQDGKGGMSATTKGTENGTVKTTMTPEGLIHVEIQSMTIEQLCGQLGALLARPIVDQTGLKGKYSLVLEFRREDLMALAAAMGQAPAAGGDGAGAPGSGAAPAAADPSGGSSIFKSMDKLGLKLESTKAPVAMMVIDHVEKVPTEN
jgi:uncharacterized protein (TIGR03435 family)